MTKQDAVISSQGDRRLFVAAAFVICVCIAAIAVAGAWWLTRSGNEDPVEADNSACVRAMEARAEAARAAVEEFGENAILSDGVPLECLQ